MLFEIIDQNKNETNPTDDVATPAQPDITDEDGGAADTTNPVNDSGSERKLVSVAAKIVLAALPVFGI